MIDPASDNTQHSTRLNVQPLSSCCLTIPTTANQATGMPTSSLSSSSSFISATYLMASVYQKWPLIWESSSQSNSRDRLIQPLKCIRLATSYLEAVGLHLEEKKSLTVVSSLQTEDLLVDDDKDLHSFSEEACFSDSDDLIIMDEHEETDILTHFSQEEEDR